MEDNMDIRLRTVRILQLLSKSEANCMQMLSAECASRLLLKIDYPRLNEEYKKKLIVSITLINKNLFCELISKASIQKCRHHLEYDRERRQKDDERSAQLCAYY